MGQRTNWPQNVCNITAHRIDISRFKDSTGKKKSRICWLKIDEWMGCSERVLSSCWWVNVFRTWHTLHSEWDRELEIRLYYVNRIKLNRNGILQYVGNLIKFHLNCPHRYLLNVLSFLFYSHLPPFLCFNSTLFHSQSLTPSLPLAPYAHSINTRIKLKFKNPLAEYLLFVGRGIWQKINILHHLNTDTHEHTRWCVK